MRDKITTFRIVNERVHDIEWAGETVGELRKLLEFAGHDVKDAVVTITDPKGRADRIVAATDDTVIEDYRLVTFRTESEDYPALHARVRALGREKLRKAKIKRAREAEVHASCIKAAPASAGSKREVSATINGGASKEFKGLQVTPTTDGVNISISL
jgi:hypothetical protein